MLRNSTAGASAEAEYRALRRRWRRRVLPQVRLVLWPLIGLTLLGAALPAPWAWMSGCLCGAFLSMWLWIRDAVPQHIERWQDGAEGERRTAKVLRRLDREGWLVQHDLVGTKGNIDHLAIGPAGVFVLDSKRWFGDVTITDAIVTVTPKDNARAAWSPTGLARSMRGMGVRQKDAIERLTGIRTWVQVVVVIWAPFEEKAKEVDNVAYVHGDYLLSWLQARPLRLSPDQLARIRAKLGTEAA